MADQFVFFCLKKKKLLSFTHASDWVHWMSETSRHLCVFRHRSMTLGKCRVSLKRNKCSQLVTPISYCSFAVFWLMAEMFHLYFTIGAKEKKSNEQWAFLTFNIYISFYLKTIVSSFLIFFCFVFRIF